MLGLRSASSRVLVSVLLFSSGLFASPQLEFNRVPDAPESSNQQVISRKRFSTQNRVEIGVFPYDATLRNDYVKHPYAAHITLGYHIWDWLSLHAYGGYAFLRSESDLMKRVRQEVQAKGDAALALKDFGFSNSFYTTWLAGGNIEWAPFYGKLSLSSEFETNFQLYAFGGGGAEGYERLTPLGVVDANGVRWAANSGVGLRIFFADFLAFRFQLQQTFGLSPISNEIAGRTWAHVGFGFFI